ncbi:uncharacterized protein LOC131173897 isoform X1 [Hevea brasiliensis]|uniref:uncharacterized protein LOC131173897 isoform X1 n=1 Tax=Hevea brasiliensis TaxID=3981 RepID=UPI0025D9ED7E|nr:uncharacterized protein LOC131173897 isoform X1 [Hevea brasiliensis]
MGCAGSSQSKADGAVKKIRKPKPWKHPQPITKSQLIQLRDEFWDTAPHYGGRKGLLSLYIQKGACLLKYAELHAAMLVVDSVAGESSGKLGSTAAEKEKVPLEFADWVKEGKRKI